ncbi:Transglycosylase SLT domain protein [compost metagenome]
MTLEAKGFFDNKRFFVVMSATILSLSVASMISGCSTTDKRNIVSQQQLKSGEKSSSHHMIAGSSKITRPTEAFVRSEFALGWGRKALPSSVESNETAFVTPSPLLDNERGSKAALAKHQKPDALNSVEFAKLLTIAYKIPEKKANNFADWILEATSDVDVPEELLAGVIMAESTFNYHPVSSVGAVGPGQLKPKFWKELCPNIKDPKHNVKCAATVLHHYYDDYCDREWNCAVRTYNVGPTNMKSQKFAKASKIYLNKVSGHTRLLVNVKKTEQANILTSLNNPIIPYKKAQKI